MGTVSVTMRARMVTPIWLEWSFKQTFKRPAGVGNSRNR